MSTRKPRPRAAVARAAPWLLVAFLFTAPPADAQPASDTSAATATAPAPDEATGPEEESASPEAETGFEETVVVTAEKTARSLRDTATSTVVVDGDDLDRSPGISGSAALLAGIANVTGTGNGNTAPAVRGVDGTGAAQGGNAFFAGTRPRLNVQVDGRPASYNEVTFGDATLWDVEQIEVLRGPQSTLQGRNAVAGSMVIKTRDPSWTPEARLRAQAGDRGGRRLAFVVSGPLAGERLAGRLAASYEERDSHVDGYESFPGVDDVGLYRNVTARGKLLWQMSDRASTQFTLNHADYRGPQGEAVVRPFDAHRTATAEMPVFRPRSDSVIAESFVALNERWSAENLFSFTALQVERLAPVGTGIADIDTDEWLWEPRLHYRRGGGSRTELVLGAYFFRADQDESIDFPVPEAFVDRVDTEALFAEATLGLAERWDLVAGLRGERERHRRSGGDGTVLVFDPVDETVDVLLPKLGVAFRPNDAWTLGLTAARGYSGGGGGITLDLPIVNYRYEPEYVRNYEAWFRAEVAAARVFLTGNLFHADYTDMQLPFDLTPDDPTNFSTEIRNADRVRTRGAELGARWRVRRRLEVSGEIGLLDTEVTRYPGSGFEGHELPRSPDWTATVAGRWRHPRGFDVGLRLRYSDGYFSDLRNHPRDRVAAHWVADLDAGWELGRWRLFAFVNNVTDAGEVVDIFPGATPELDTAHVQHPRRFGTGVEVGF